MRKEINSCASVLFNGDFFYICTMSRGLLRFAEPDAPPKYLDPNVSDEILGCTLRIALGASKNVSAEEFQRVFQSGVVQRLAEERDVWAMKKYGYKTRRAMYTNMDSCSVTVMTDQIEISPSHHDSIDGYSATKDRGPQPLYVPASISDAGLGVALREGFNRCTSSFK